jgi:quercetin dioxygenase-like cupin family protein
MKKLILPLVCLSLFSCDKEMSLPDPLEAGWNGEKVCEVLEDNKDLRVLKCTFPPGVGHEKHKHQPHFGYTLQGSTFKITDDRGEQTFDVNTGTSFSKDQVSEHEVVNVGDSTAVFLIIEYK